MTLQVLRHDIASTGDERLWGIHSCQASLYLEDLPYAAILPCWCRWSFHLAAAASL